MSIGRNVFPFSSYSSVVYIKKKCLSLFVYEYARFNGTAIVQNTKNSDVKKEGHSSVKRTGKRTLMRERGKYRSPSWQENDIKLNAPA